jgi:L-asparaginase II
MSPIPLPAHVPLVISLRGEHVENVHYGSIAVSDAAGRRLAGCGDTAFPVFTRSALKPLQALPLVLAGGARHFALNREQLAITCASHSGEPRHVAVVAGLLEKIGASVSDLRCGTHVPLHHAATGEPLPAGFVPSALHHNCSGKHAGFLAWCRLHGMPFADYLDLDHPLQRTVREVVATVAGAAEELPSGTDGCSAPNYALPLAALARAYARLAADRDGAAGEALAALFEAMTAAPEMVAGSHRPDTLLMQAGGGDWVAKGGAEAVQAVGVRSRGLGLAIKIADGNAAALRVATAAVLDRLGLLAGAALEAIGPWREATLRNHAGTATGRMVPVFDLARA